MVSEANSESHPAAILSAEALTEDVGSLWLQLQKQGAAYAVVVYVTLDGFKWCHAGGPKEKSYTAKYGHGYVGLYNRYAEMGQILDDVFYVAQQENYL